MNGLRVMLDYNKVYVYGRYYYKDEATNKNIVKDKFIFSIPKDEVKNKQYLTNDYSMYEDLFISKNVFYHELIEKLDKLRKKIRK